MTPTTPAAASAGPTDCHIPVTASPFFPVERTDPTRDPLASPEIPMTETMTDPDLDAYVANMLADAESGTWSDVVTRLATRVAADARMVSDLIRGEQAAYAAGILHGPQQAMEWLGGLLSGPGNLPHSDTPDPAWYAADRHRGAVDERPVPENCATITEPGTAPPTRALPGFTGMGAHHTQVADGRWWATADDRAHLVAFTEPVPGAGDLMIAIDEWRAETDAKLATPVEWWRPADLPDLPGTVEVHLDGPTGRGLAVATVAGRRRYVDANRRRWVEACLPPDVEWTVEQLGGDGGPLRWSAPDGLVWAYLVPVRLSGDAAAAVAR
jgi:hypothetical protein